MMKILKKVQVHPAVQAGWCWCEVPAGMVSLPHMGLYYTLDSAAVHCTVIPDTLVKCCAV